MSNGSDIVVLQSNNQILKSYQSLQRFITNMMKSYIPTMSRNRVVMNLNFDYINMQYGATR